MSPVRGQFWPLSHNLNNFDRGPLDDAKFKIYQVPALWSHRRRFLKIAVLKPFFGPHDLLVQSTETIWTTLVGDMARIISVKFGQNLVSGFRRDAIWRKSWHPTHNARRRTKTGHNNSPWAKTEQTIHQMAFLLRSTAPAEPPSNIAIWGSCIHTMLPNTDELYSEYLFAYCRIELHIYFMNNHIQLNSK